MKTALYRHFDAVGQLLYVGISLSAVARLAGHKQTAHWFENIARVDIEWHPTREAALEAEVSAIQLEHPLHNVQHARATPIDHRHHLNPGPSFAIRHVASGRRDGNYPSRDDGDDMLAWWRASFPRDQFELLEAPAGGRGATAGAIPLRAYEAEQWSAS